MANPNTKVRVDRRLLEGMTKRERQAFVREVRRRELERLARARKRRRLIGWCTAGAAVVAVGALAASAIVGNAQAAAAAAAAGPANMLSDGLLLQGSEDGTATTAVTTAALAEGETPTVNYSDVASTGILDLQVYLDMSTADAATFWATNGATLESYAAAGSITLELHPVASDASDADAVGAVAAFGCIADALPDSALTMWSAILDTTTNNEEYDITFSRSVLSSVASTAGIADEGIIACIEDEEFTIWATAASARAAASVPYVTSIDAVADVTAAPVIIAAGSVYTGALDDADAFTAFLSEAYATATATEETTDSDG